MAADKSTLWKTGNIDVCWEQSRGYEAEKKIVEDTIIETFGKNSGLNFTGWGECKSNSMGLRIYTGNVHPRVKAFGCRLDGVKNGIELNFEFKLSGFQPCRASKVNLKECISRIATHEFGHAVGLHHEQNRTDRPSDDFCVRERFQSIIPNELLIGKYDSHSIMNYCSPSIWDDYSLPIFSEKDISSINQLYPKEKTKISSTSLNDCAASTLKGFKRESKNVNISEVCEGLNGFQVFIEGKSENTLGLIISKDGKDMISDNPYSKTISFGSSEVPRSLSGELTGSKIDWVYSGSNLLGLVLKRVNGRKTYEAFTFNESGGFFCHLSSDENMLKAASHLENGSCSN